MLPVHFVHLKSLMMVLTAVFGSVAGVTALNSFSGANGKNSFSFVLTANPTAPSLEANASAQSAIAVSGLNGFTGQVALSLFFPGSKLPALLNPTIVNVPTSGEATSTLTVTAPWNATAGSYSIIVVGVAGSQRKTTYSSTLVSVQVLSNHDFTIRAIPSSITNFQGFTNTTTIVLTSGNSYNGTIALSATVPFGYIAVTGGQSPVVLAAGQKVTSTIQIGTSSATALGTYNITVTGTSGLLTHSAIITFTVLKDAPPTEKLSLSSFSFSSSTNVTLSIQNLGTTSVTLQSYTVRDSIGDAWTLNNWAGSSIAPNTAASANILISTSCSSCTYSGILGLFTQFVPGQSYTISVTTAMNNQFSFPVTR